MNNKEQLAQEATHRNRTATTMNNSNNKERRQQHSTWMNSKTGRTVTITD